MRFLALAADYDGTLALGGRVTPELVASLGRLRASARKLVLVSGRRLEDLVEIFPEHRIFDRLVLENGALLYRPASREQRLLAEPAPAALAARLAERGVSPLAVGRVLIATTEPHDTAALEVIHELGIEWQLIFNRGSVMLLPSGVNKATGLAEALAELELSPHNVVAIGDAENDLAMLQRCELGVAVGDAVPQIRERADLVAPGGNGRSVSWLVEMLLEDDLRRFQERLTRKV